MINWRIADFGEKALNMRVSPKEIFMKSLSKKLCVALLAAVAAVCIGMAFLFPNGISVSAAAKVLNNEAYFDIENGTFKGLTTDGEIAAGNDYFKIEFPAGLTVTKIADRAMRNNTKLEEITIPNGITFIGQYAFEGCTGLKEISIPDSVTEINSNAFTGCTSLSSVKLPENAGFTDINSRTFYGCTSLLSITLPSYIEYVGTNAFGGCNRLVEVCNKSSLDISGKGGLNPLNVYTPTSGSTKIQPADANGFIFYAGGTQSGNYLLDYRGTQTEITLPADYNGGNYAVYSEVFKGDTALKSVTIPANSKITSLGSGTFSGCTALESVSFNGNNLSVIEGNLFAGCTALESIDIPASVTSIGAYAFDGCISLKTVKFSKLVTEVGNVTTEAYELKTIHSNAFENCKSLEVIELPASVTSVEQGVFAGCDKLSTVYLPDSATFANDTFDASSGVLLIAADKDKCEYYRSGNLYGYSLAYIVKLNLVYGGKSHLEDRLNLGYHYALKDDGKTWTILENSQTTMPVQEGYKASVWYREEACTTKLNKDDLDGLLGAGATATIYANNYSHETLLSALNVSNSLVYNGNEFTYAEAIGWNDALENIYDVSISGYSMSGTTPDKMLNAGTYTLAIELDPAYGEWETPLSVNVTVQQAVKDLTTDFHWVTIGKDADGQTVFKELDPTDAAKTLYLYKNDSNARVPYTEPYEGKNPDSSVTVITSYLTYSGEEYTLVLSEDEEYGGSFKVTYSGTYSASEPGVYKVNATIVADPNYVYKTTEGKYASDRGLEVENYDGSGMRVISKTWYIATARTNKLITADGDEYKISSAGVYNDLGGAPTVPIAAIGHGDEEQFITFDLRRSELNANDYKPVCGGMSYSAFPNVINSSMPVGDYELTIKLGKYTDSTGEEFSPVTFVYNFTIENKHYGKYGEVKFDVNENGVSEVKASTTVQFAQISGWDNLDKAGSLHALPTGDNFWTIHPEYYTDFAIYYSVVSEAGSSGGYYPVKDYEDERTVVFPKNVGVYTINYRISAPGYTPRTGSYVLVIYREINPESVKETIDAMHVVYNGTAQTPNIDTYEYRAVYIDNELDADVVKAKEALGIDGYYDYINATDYPLALVIRDEHRVERAGCYLYRWEGWQSSAVSVQQYARVTFTVNKADNNTRTDLTATAWNYGEYSPEKNAISWSTDWVTDVKAFDFELISIGNESKSYLFSVRNGVNEFGQADSGVYRLVATCPAGDNYDVGTAEIGLVIGAAEISWGTAPYIESWKYGDFKKMFAAPQPVLNSHVSSLSSKILGDAYYISAEDYNQGNASGRYSTISELIAASGDENGEVPAGRYYLVYSYAAQGNYAQFTDLVGFQVLKADNYWDTPPVVSGWAYGDKSIDYLTYKPEFAPHYGDPKKVVIQFMALDANNMQLTGWEYSLADLGLDEYGKLNVGDYQVKATMSGSDNYEEMAEFIMRFKVTKASNSWDEIPNVIGWSAGKISSVEDFLNVKPANGTVLISIYDSDNKVIVEDELPQNININKLKSLGAGAYVLKAYVASTDRYDELEAFVDFAIFEDTVSQTALIALTSVFAAVAIALAVAAVVLLIRRDKKIEEEFRKMIKAELDRR